MSGIRVSATITLPEEALRYTPYHASGPGGQHVNKVATAIALRFDVAASHLPQRVRQRLVQLAGRRINADGVLTIQASRHRSQSRNRDDATERLLELIRQAAAPPPKARRPTKPSRSARQKRVDSKKKRGAAKALRGRVRHDD